MKVLTTAVLCTAALGSALIAVPDRKDIQVDNNRYTPSIVSVRAGDTLVFTNRQNGLHNVQFAADSLSDAAHRLIDAAMPGRPKRTWSRQVALAGPLLADAGDTYRIVVPSLPPGRYQFFCTPHYAAMRGTLVVE
jgi:plastocyanin